MSVYSGSKNAVCRVRIKAIFSIMNVSGNVDEGKANIVGSKGLIGD